VIFAVFRVQGWNPYVTCVLHQNFSFFSAAFWWNCLSQSVCGRHNPIADFAAWLLDVEAAYIYSIVGSAVAEIGFLLALDRSCIETVGLEETKFGVVEAAKFCAITA
jgi:hypothetical protein